MVHSATVASGEDILILQPLVPQSSLNKFIMVVLCQIAKISLLSPFMEAEKNFLLNISNALGSGSQNA